MDFSIDGYKAEKVKEDGAFEPIKGKYNAGFEYARVEDYQGDKKEFQGHKFFRYALIICDDENYSGRKLWGSFNLVSATADKKGKTKLDKLRDILFTLGLNSSFLNEEDLLAEAEKLVEKIVRVSCRYFTPPDADGPIQLHTILGEVDNSTSSVEKPKF